MAIGLSGSKGGIYGKQEVSQNSNWYIEVFRRLTKLIKER